MAYQFHYTPTGTGAISGTEVLEQTEDAINDLGNTAISGVQEALDRAERALTNSANAVDDAQTALNTANNAEGVAIQAQNDVSNLSGTVTNIGNRVTTAEGNITNLQGRMTTAEGKITNLQGRMTTAEGNIGNLQTAVSTAQATANSAQQTATTARQQSYVFRYSSTALTPSSTNSNTLLDNTDNLKVGDKVIDSSGVLFSVTAIDTQNSTFTIGTALIDLLSSDLFNSANTWTENNQFAKKADLTNITSVENTTFAFTALNNTIFFNTRGSSNFKSYGTFLFAGYGSGSEPDRYGQIQLLRSTDKNGDTGNGYIPDSSFKMWRVAPHYLVMDFMEAVRVTNDGTENSLKPITNNATDLGTSTNKWKSFNGVEPSSLSLPDLSNGIDISSYLINAGTSTPSEYTPSVNGYICVQIGANEPPFIRMYNDYGFDNTVYSERNDIGSTSGGTYSRFASLIFPATKNVKVYIIIMPSTFRIISAKFFPCQGNV